MCASYHPDCFVPLPEGHRFPTGKFPILHNILLKEGIPGNLAGGTHHAFPGHGEGFCVLNDVAVAASVLRRYGAVRRSLIIDLDAHLGNWAFRLS